DEAGVVVVGMDGRRGPGRFLGARTAGRESEDRNGSQSHPRRVTAAIGATQAFRLWSAPMLTLVLVAAGLAYPPAARGAVVDEYAGRKVDAPFRWMEDLDSPQVKQWVEEENKLTFGYLEKLPQRE